MIKGVHSVMIGTEEFGRLLPFYRDVLGLNVQMEGDEFAVLADGKLAVERHSEVHGRSREPNRVMVNFQVGDCQTEYERLRGKGVEFVRQPSQEDGFTIATFLDPDGNVLQLFEGG